MAAFEKDGNQGGLNVLGMLSLPWLLAAGGLGALVWAGGVWNIIANTRLLALMIEGGVVRFHDKQIGPIDGVPELKYFLASQDPIVWPLVGLAILLMFAFWALKGTQVHFLLPKAARASAGAFEHLRCYSLSLGNDRWLPFRAGDAALLRRLEATGIDSKAAMETVENARFMAVLELTFLSVVGLLLLGWTTWLSQVFWALTILAVGYLFLKREGSWDSGIDLLGAVPRVWSRLGANPAYLASVFAFSLAAFTSEHIAVYALSQAFTSTNVIINIEFPVFLTALVAGNIARLIPVTPGGLGQFEWGFALAIYVSGTGMPEAATMALLFMVVRYSAGALFNLLLRLREGAASAGGVSSLLSVMRAA